MNPTGEMSDVHIQSKTKLVRSLSSTPSQAEKRLRDEVSKSISNDWMDCRVRFVQES